MFDLLLHSRDRAYTIPSLLALLDAGGARAVELIAPGQYDPRHFLRDRDLLERSATLSGTERWALAERLSGGLTKHIAYVVNSNRPDDPVARLTDDWRDMVPVFRDMDHRVVARGIQSGGRLKADLAPGQPYRAPLPVLAPEIAVRVDGKSTLGQISVDLRAVAEVDDDAFLGQFEMFRDAFGDINRLLFHRAEAPSHDVSPDAGE